MGELPVRHGDADDFLGAAGGPGDVADRILVMREGRLVAELAHAEASEERIVTEATGQARQEAA